MTVLSYGYEKPANPDTGDIFFPAMERNIQRLNDHTHNGLNSAPLASRTVSLPSGSWVLAPIGGGLYRQVLTFPGTFTYDTADLWFKLSTGELVYPTVERITSTTVYVYCNDNTKTYTAYVR